MALFFRPANDADVGLEGHGRVSDLGSKPGRRACLGVAGAVRVDGCGDLRVAVDRGLHEHDRGGVLDGTDRQTSRMDYASGMSAWRRE